MDDERAAKLSIIGLFFGLLAASGVRRRNPALQMRPVEWMQLGLAAHRIGRSLTWEGVGVPIREPFTATRDDDSGAGETVVAKGAGLRATIGELFSCPVCAATWVAAGLAVGMQLAPRLTRLTITVFSAAGLAHIVESVVEWLTWAGRADRSEVGRQSD